IVATRNAHMVQEASELAQQLVHAAKQSILLCLRNPYDAGVIDADVKLCTCGDSAPSLQAVVDALAGDFIPDGRLPVEMV
ncbi:MAG TPA: hypothetical protein VHL11_15820, partial [Phototrophicaceae bacterium]|nr:hypothetical protein [Phototrophicaceae bacterium]